MSSSFHCTFCGSKLIVINLSMVAPPYLGIAMLSTQIRC
jgi:hypothetical protein